MFDKPTLARGEEAFAIELLDQMPAIVLLGARQIGKTTLAHNLVSRLGKPTLYLDLERPSDMDRLREPELALEELRDTCVMIDEVQRMPQPVSDTSGDDRPLSPTGSVCALGVCPANSRPAGSRKPSR